MSLAQQSPARPEPGPGPLPDSESDRAGGLGPATSSLARPMAPPPASPVPSKHGQGLPVMAASAALRVSRPAGPGRDRVVVKWQHLSRLRPGPGPGGTGTASLSHAARDNLALSDSDSAASLSCSNRD